MGAVGPLNETGIGDAPRLSPDGKRLATSPVNEETSNRDIWVIDLARDLPTRVTFDPSIDVTPIWSPDGRRLAYFSIQRRGVFQRAANGAGPEELLFEMTSVGNHDWSRDGRFIFFTRLDEQTGRDVWVAPLTGSGKPYPLLNTGFDEWRPQLSPDGRWLAYQSNESGRLEIYVQSFPEPGHKVKVSKGGGILPRWRRDGRELYFVAADDKLMAAPVETGANFSAGAPVPLFAGVPEICEPASPWITTMAATISGSSPGGPAMPTNQPWSSP